MTAADKRCDRLSAYGVNLTGLALTSSQLTAGGGLTKRLTTRTRADGLTTLSADMRDPADELTSLA